MSNGGDRQGAGVDRTRQDGERRRMPGETGADRQTDRQTDRQYSNQLLCCYSFASVKATEPFIGVFFLKNRKARTSDEIASNTDLVQSKEFCRVSD